MRIINLEKLLPADIPLGERIIWHGRPRWLSLMRRAFFGDFVALYFGVMTIVNLAWSYANSGAWAAMLSAAKTAGAGAMALALLALLAWLSARTSLYAMTDKRLVMKIGIALQVFFNIPFSSIESAAVRVFADGTGDIPIGLNGAQHIAYLHLWPHARAFRLKHPEPALRSVAGAQEVAETLSRALIKACNERNDSIGLAPQGLPENTKSAPSYPQGAIAAV